MARLGRALALVVCAGLAACDFDGGVEPPAQIDCVSDSRLVTLPERPRPLEAPAAAPPWLSGRAAAAGEAELFIAHREAGELVVLDLATLAPSRRVPLGAGSRPEQVVVGPDGDAWVTLRGGAAVAHVPPGAATPDALVPVGSEPFGLALSADAATLYVTVAGARALALVETATAREVARLPLGPAARGVAVSPAGWLLVVDQHGPAATWPLDAAGRPSGPAQPVRLRQGNPWQADRPAVVAGYRPTRAFAAAPHPETGAVLVAHVQVDPRTAAATDEGYGAERLDPELGVALRPVELTVTSVEAPGRAGPREAELPVLDGGAPLPGRPLLPHLFDQPVDVLHHPVWTLAFVVAEGTDNILVINTAARDPMRAPVARIAVGAGPRAIALDRLGTRAFVWNAQDATVSEVDLWPLRDLPAGSLAPPADHSFFCAPLRLSPPRVAAPADLALTAALTAVRTAVVGGDPTPEAVARGRRLFTFAGGGDISHAGQFACATCHVEGGEDKLSWRIGGQPRQTPALARRLEDTAPYNWEGTRAELQANMDQTIARLGGAGLSAADKADLEAFLLHGLAPPNPHRRADGRLTREQARGQALFNRPDVGCAGCHAGPAFTDGALHAIALPGADPATERPLNTPSLRGLYYTAPYLHDGSAPTLAAVLQRTEGVMGHTAHLSDADRAALVAYLLTL